MPRIARGLEGNCIYHVLNRGNGRQEIFHKTGDYEAFIEILKEAQKRFAVKILAYCLMPNHFHLALEPGKGEYLSKWMQWVMTSHVRKYHRHYESSGHIWQGRYKSFMLQDDRHLLAVLRYIEGNPLRARLVASAKEWKWSSHNENAGITCKSLVSALPMELPSDWGRYVDEPLTAKEMEKLRESANRQAPYGTDDWKIKMCSEFGLLSTIRKRGRPKKEKENAEK